jgi:hypothetical protein
LIGAQLVQELDFRLCSCAIPRSVENGKRGLIFGGIEEGFLLKFLVVKFELWNFCCILHVMGILLNLAYHKNLLHFSRHGNFIEFSISQNFYCILSEIYCTSPKILENQF